VNGIVLVVAVAVAGIEALKEVEDTKLALNETAQVDDSSSCKVVVDDSWPYFSVGSSILWTS